MIGGDGAGEDGSELGSDEQSGGSGDEHLRRRRAETNLVQNRATFIGEPADGAERRSGTVFKPLWARNVSSPRKGVRAFTMTRL